MSRPMRISTPFCRRSSRKSSSLMLTHSRRPLTRALSASGVSCQVTCVVGMWPRRRATLRRLLRCWWNVRRQWARPERPCSSSAFGRGVHLHPFLVRAACTGVGGPFQVPGNYLTDGHEDSQIRQAHPHRAVRRMVDEEETKSNHSCEPDPIKGDGPAQRFFSDGFHGYGQYPSITHLTRAEGHAWQTSRRGAG
jgi:hypothetical protein